MTPSDLLRAAGEALYGEQWQAPLAEGLGINRRTIRRWLDGDNEPPAGVWAALAAICHDRRETLAEIGTALGEAARTAEAP